MEKQNNNNKFSFKKYLYKYKKNFIWYILIGGVLYSIINLALMLILAESISFITLGIKYGESIYYTKAIYCFLICCGILVIKRISIYADLIMERASLKIIRDLNIDLTKQAFKLNSETYSNYGTGIFAKRILTDPDSFSKNFSDIIYEVSDFIISLVAVIYIISLNAYVTIAMAILTVIVFTIEFFRAKLYKKNYKKVLENEDDIHSITTEIVKSEKDIKAIGLENELFDKVSNAHVKARKSWFKFYSIEQYFNFLNSVVVYAGIVAILIIGVILMDKGFITMAVLMIIYSNTGEMIDVPFQIKNIIDAVNGCKLSVTRMASLFDEKNFVTEKFGDVNLDNVKGSIEFKNVAYTINEYEIIDSEELHKNKKDNNIDSSVQRKIISSNQIFKDLNFKIEPNTTVAFVGKSGSGKSTILDLASKMKVVDSGEILIDGTNINLLTKDCLRNTIALTSQFPYIFDMTIKENLLLANKNATDEDIENVLKNVSLYEFVMGLPKTLDTKIGENGVKLSGGQKQRLAIARALLKKAKILIFDESTSSLDNFAQETIKNTIDSLKGKSTIIIVAHRLSTIKNVDKIFFLDNGEIVDSGTFEELFEHNELFKSMYLIEDK